MGKYDRIIVVMNDCHYYFDESFVLGLRCEIYVSGMQYM